ncbi:helix-turn-helix transcriptional regulator [Flagellimonas sp.]|uniref:helix-turn-helix transcriptional regulator n=1 Tax=Flagellimonas sp. TaxID=2058762 RepID=UPI003F4A2A0E
MKRLHRLTSLLIKFQTKKSLKVKDLSEHYNVSTRTIYRDIKALEDAGVPIGYEPGEDYFLLEGYQLPPIHFTLEESHAVVTAKAIMAQNSDVSLVNNFNKVVDKVKAVLKSSHKEATFEIESRIAPSVYKQQFSSDTLLDIQKSITAFNVLHLDYESASGVRTSRKVRPLAVYFTQDHWILVAYCLLREENREFRLDRIKNLTPTSEFFPPNHFQLEDYFKKYS